jgi:hypothetical protein
MKLTKAKLQQIIKEELDSIINEYDPPTSQTFGIGDPGSMNSPSQGERSKKCKDAGGMMAGDECQDPNTGKPINIDETVKEYGAPVFSPKKQKSQYARQMPVADKDDRTKLEKAVSKDKRLKEDDLDEETDWLGGIKSTGECTPSTKPGCKGRAKAFAQRAQKGDIHDDNLKKGKNPHGPG